MRWTYPLGLVCLVVVCGLGGCAAPPSQPQAELQLQYYSVDPYTVVLRATVRNGRVDYALLDREYATDLAIYLDVVSRTGPRSQPAQFPGPDPDLAYYLNVHNALVLHNWLQRGAARANPNTTLPRSTFFADRWVVDGQHLSLNDLRERILTRHSDPRLPFAIVRGHRGGALLPAEPIDPQHWDAQLERAMQRYMAQPDVLRVMGDGVLEVSPLLFEHASRFEPLGGLPGLIERHLDEQDPRRTPAIHAAVARRVRAMSSDWRINGAF